MVVFGLNEAAPTKTTQYTSYLLKLLPLVAFFVPLALLFLLNPMEPYNVSVQDSFQLMWKGRTFQLFFIWLIALEFILSWETIKTKINLLNRVRMLAYAIALALPTIYIVAEYYLGLNTAITTLSLQSGVAWANSMPLAIEYLVFSALFLIIVYSAFGKQGLTGFALPALFVALVGLLYTIDNVFPYGEFTPFQLLVPTTASLAASVLGWIGYTTVPGTDTLTGMPTLTVSNSAGTATFAIAWPCAGIESLLIFTAVALLFLKRMSISWKIKIGYFAFGAAITYLINVLRIATIFTLGVQYGTDSLQVSDFHFYYGPLYAMAWIVFYPIIIIATTVAWRKIRKPQLKRLNPA
ncbi:MAG TPA: exosortase/archaeosortase family protein [Candidatus Nanoarchaeia archaeon]|nr:exosortase/archaeosortase family protein [Candidatus Nanoarchaeia archaeon]